jgi:hypothetical protein
MNEWREGEVNTASNRGSAWFCRACDVSSHLQLPAPSPKSPRHSTAYRCQDRHTANNAHHRGRDGSDDGSRSNWNWRSPLLLILCARSPSRKQLRNRLHVCRPPAQNIFAKRSAYGQFTTYEGDRINYTSRRSRCLLSTLALKYLGTGWGLSKNFSTHEKRRHAHTPHSDTIHVRSPSKCLSTLLSHHVCVNITTHTLLNRESRQGCDIMLLVPKALTATYDTGQSI